MGRKSQIPQLEAKIGKYLFIYLTDAANSGKQPLEIASELGISKSQVYNFIDKYNLKDKFKEASRAKRISISGELKALIDQYLADVTGARRSKKTVSNYEDGLYGYLSWLEQTGKSPSLSTWLNTDIMREYFLSYLSTSEERIGRKGKVVKGILNASTLNANRMILRAFGNWLILNDLADKNPLRVVKSFTEEKRDPEDIPDDIILKILNSFDNSFLGIRNKTLIALFVDTGLRLDGMVNLKANTIDIDTGWGKVTEKGDKERDFCLSPIALEQLNLYLRVRKPLAKCNFLWIIEDGTQWMRDTLRAWVSTMNKYSTPEYNVHSHAFRHVWARQMSESGVDIMALSIMGGWNDIKLVQHYARAYAAKKAWKPHAEASLITKLMGKGDG